MLSQIALANAAAEIRVAESALSRIVAELQNQNVWNGDDADRFQREWHDLVTARLAAASARIDSCVFVPFG
jgi:hypothetical protein